MAKINKVATPITPAEITELEKLCEAATEGPWEWMLHDHSMASLGVLPNPGFGDPLVLNVGPCKSRTDRAEPKEWKWGRCTTPTENDAKFIAAARTALPRLLAEVKANKARCAKLEATLKPFAKYAERVAESIPDTAKMASLPTGVGSVGKFTVGDCRRAHGVLKGDE